MRYADRKEKVTWLARLKELGGISWRAGLQTQFLEPRHKADCLGGLHDGRGQLGPGGTGKGSTSELRKR